MNAKLDLHQIISPTHCDLYELRRRNIDRNYEARKILVLKSYQIGKH